jgi:uncharacterized membrane protein HdeD (DUF308 family)
MVKSLSTYLIVRGVLALIVGIVAVAWPGVTVYALVLLFGVYVFMDAVVQAVRAFSGLRAGAANARILIALVDVAAGVAAIAYPNITAVALVVIVAIWAIAFAVLELFAAFGASETAGTGGWFVVAGLVSIAFGFVLVGRPDVGAVSLAVIYGILSPGLRDYRDRARGAGPSRCGRTIRLFDHLITVIFRGRRRAGRRRGAGVMIGTDARSWVCNGRKVVTWL